MTYHAKGDLRITVTEESQTAFVLAFPGYVEEHPDLDLFGLHTENGIEQIKAVLEAWHCEYFKTEKNPANQEETILDFLFDDNWNDEYFDYFIQFLAGLGLGVQGHFSGEDGNTWGYESNPENKITYLNYTLVESREEKTLKKDSATLKSIKGVLTSEESVGASVEYLLDKVRELVQ